jgi:hypothetical protein
LNSVLDDPRRTLLGPLAAIARPRNRQSPPTLSLASPPRPPQGQQS